MSTITNKHYSFRRPTGSKLQEREIMHKKHSISPGNASNIGRSLEEPTGAELQKMLDMKQRDLDFAAQLGRSLLIEKKELLDKNEFLEESLASKIEIITQLQRTLKQRSNLVHTIMDLESEQDEGQQNGLDLKSEELLRLKQQIKRLNDENGELQVKTRHLEELKLTVEKREEQRIDEYLFQLRAANLKVAQLQSQLNEKTNQCETQTEEVQHLLKEISQRKVRERILWDENDNLQSRLDDALSNHEQLRNEMEQLQERHFDLIAMLHEIEEELKMHREKEAKLLIMPPKRTNSTDSLYDSLASELEGADSGCYNTPMFSARYGPSPHWSSISSDQQPCCSSTTIDNHHQHQIAHSLEMEPIMEQTFTTNDSKTIEFTDMAVVNGNGQYDRLECNQKQQQSFDVPSRALLQVVRHTFNDRQKFRRMSPSRKQHSSIFQQQQEDHEDNLMMPDEEQHTPTLTTEMKIVSDYNVGTGKNERQSTENRTIEPNEADAKIFYDASCSPIQFSKLSSSNTTPRNKKTLNHKQFKSTAVQTTPTITQFSMNKQRKLITSKIQQSNAQIQNQSEKGYHHHHQMTSSSSAESVDSLEEYNPSQLGAPGKPGTKDLDISIKRLKLRNEISKQYQRFRKCKGLQAEKYNFYTQSGQKALDACQNRKFDLFSKMTTGTGVISSSFFANVHYRRPMKCSNFLNQLTRMKISGQKTIGFNQIEAFPSLSTSTSSTSLMTAAMIAFESPNNKHISKI